MITPARKRDDGVRQTNISLDCEALAWLAKRAVSKRAYGHYVSRLLYEDRVRFEERQRREQEGAALKAEAKTAR